MPRGSTPTLGGPSWPRGPPSARWAVANDPECSEKTSGLSLTIARVASSLLACPGCWRKATAAWPKPETSREKASAAPRNGAPSQLDGLTWSGMPTFAPKRRRAQTRSTNSSSGSCQATTPPPWTSIPTRGELPSFGSLTGVLMLRSTGVPNSDQRRPL